jgi:hypothetical protein
VHGPHVHVLMSEELQYDAPARYTDDRASEGLYAAAVATAATALRRATRIAKNSAENKHTSFSEESRVRHRVASCVCALCALCVCVFVCG